MQIAIVRRFGNWLNPEHQKFDSIMMVATLLHPALRRVLSDSERAIAVKGVLQYSRKWYPASHDDSSCGIIEGNAFVSNKVCD